MPKSEERDLLSRAFPGFDELPSSELTAGEKAVHEAAADAHRIYIEQNEIPISHVDIVDDWGDEDDGVL